MDPFKVALTLSKSEFMHLRKWSDGFLRAGQGNPASAKNCVKPTNVRKISPSPGLELRTQYIENNSHIY